MEFRVHTPPFPPSAELIARVRDLRRAVWAGEMNHDFDERVDLESVHCCAYENDVLIAASRVTVCTRPDVLVDYAPLSELLDGWPSPFALLTRLVVGAEFRRRGIAAQLDRMRVEAGRELGAATLVVSPRSGRPRRMAELGFQRAAIVPGVLLPEIQRDVWIASSAMPR